MVMRLIHGLVVAATCLALVNARPNSWGADCATGWVDGEQSTSPMGAPLKVDGSKCTVTVENNPTSWVPGKEYTITVSGAVDSGYALSVMDQCGQNKKETSAIMTGGDGAMDGGKENTCRYARNKLASVEFNWTAPQNAGAGEVNIMGVCGTFGGVFRSDIVTLAGGPKDDGACGPAKVIKKMTKDPVAECEDGTYTTIGTHPGMLVCYKPAGNGAYTFIMLTHGQYGAIGFNGGVKMPGTRFMAVTKASETAKVGYYRTDQYKIVEPVGGPDSADVEVACCGEGNSMAAKSTVKELCLSKDKGCTQMEDLVKGTFIFAYKAGASAGVVRHDFDGKGGGSCAFKEGSKCTLDTALPATQGNLVHGCFMILAWIVFSPIGTLFARYLKHIGPPWFKTHRGLQIAAVVLTILGFIIIMAAGVKYSDLKDKSKCHAIYGILVITFSIIQILLGVLRNIISGEHTEQHEHGERRYIFNWLHKTNGAFLFAFAIFTVHAGLTVFDKGWVADPGPSLLVAWAIIVVVFGLILEVLHKIGEDGAGYIPMFSNNKANTPAEMKARAIIIALLTAFSVATGVALIVIVADTNNTGSFGKL